MIEIGGWLVIDMSVSELLAVSVILIACLASSPLMVMHWRGTTTRFEEGNKHLPITEASQIKFAAVLPVNMVAMFSGALGAFADSLRPPVPVLPYVGGWVFFVCAGLWVSVWRSGRPRMVVPPRYRTEHWPPRR